MSDPATITDEELATYLFPWQDPEAWLIWLPVVDGLPLEDRGVRPFQKIERYLQNNAVPKLIFDLSPGLFSVELSRTLPRKVHGRAAGRSCHVSTGGTCAERPT